MKSYRFTRQIIVAGVERHDGEIVAEKDIPDGSLGPLLRCGHAVEYTEPPTNPEPAKEPEPKAAKKTTSKPDKE